MNAKETLEKIKGLFDFKVKTDEPTPAPPADPTPTGPVDPEPIDPAPTDTPPADPPAEPTDPKESETEKLKGELAEANKKIDEQAEKFSQFIEENKKMKEGLAALVELVTFLSEQPTGEPTDEKKDGIKNFGSEKKANVFEKYQEAFKQANEKLTQ